ncbi:hypothetical protein FOMPIDRAFT_1017110 [Fomitopsis schrenkii]|uniref:F-box domain-containing protein n=1 Tax=Fomitopsis schrenkii TaxID=2126942 RepID=S8E2K3_FOMSC|nr:hypothetical protein FOMPIDRAFT_1017110 [Fomitopsis schrenkii]
MIIVPVNPNGAASNEGVDLSSDRVILTSAILDPWALPQDGLYLEVIASVSRTNIDGKPSFFVAATDMDKKFHVTPFEDIPGSETAREALRARAVALPKEFTQGRRGADEADVDATVKSPHLDIGTPSKIPTFVASSKGDDGPDFFWDKVCPAAITFLFGRPATFDRAKEVYIVRVPYVTKGFIAIRFFVRKEVDDSSKKTRYRHLLLNGFIELGVSRRYQACASDVTEKPPDVQIARSTVGQLHLVALYSNGRLSRTRPTQHPVFRSDIYVPDSSWRKKGPSHGACRTVYHRDSDMGVPSVTSSGGGGDQTAGSVVKTFRVPMLQASPLEAEAKTLLRGPLLCAPTARESIVELRSNRRIRFTRSEPGRTVLSYTRKDVSLGRDRDASFRTSPRYGRAARASGRSALVAPSLDCTTVKHISRTMQAKATYVSHYGSGRIRADVSHYDLLQARSESHDNRDGPMTARQGHGQREMLSASQTALHDCHTRHGLSGIPFPAFVDCYSGPSLHLRSTALQNRRTAMGYPKAHRLSFDNLYEIAQFVHGAEDLLNLARTCRTFKGDLARMPHVWRHLRNRSFEPPPPACPSFLSEIQYTALTMESVCMSCGVQVVRLSSVVWMLRARYLINHPSFERLVLLQIASIALSHYAPNQGRRWTRAEKQYPKVELGDHRLGQDALAKVHSGETDVPFAKRLTHLHEIAESSKLWDQWISQRRKIEKATIRQRVDRIVQHLRQLGYQNELYYLGTNHQKLYEHPLGSLPENLSDEVTPDLVRWMEDIRRVKQRLRIQWGYTEFLELLEKAVERMRSKALPGSVLPHTADIAMLSRTKMLAQTAVPDGPSYVRGTKISGISGRRSVSKALVAQLPTLLDCWRDERKQQLAGLLTSMAITVRRPSRDTLNLAVAVFRCRECSVALRWPDVLSHPHLYTRDNASQSYVRNSEPEHSTVICGLSITDDVFDSANRERLRSSSQWTSSRLEVRGEEVTQIISACGSNPATADVEELDRIDARLACSLCSESGQRVLAMGWRAAVRSLAPLLCRH